MTPVPDVPSLIDQVVADAASRDPLDQLAQASQAVSDLEKIGDAVINHFVESCRRLGYSWAQISGALGVSRQAVHKRFAGSAPALGLGRLTPRTRLVLAQAVAHAQARGVTSAGTLELLLALLEPKEAVAAQVLDRAGVSEDKVLAAYQALGQPSEEEPGGPEGFAGPGAAGEWPGDTLGLSRCTLAVLRRSGEEALLLGHNYVGTEHLLLALAADDGTNGARVLEQVGLDAAAVRERTRQVFADVLAQRSTSG
jgi:ATP-dependent Clp protease ATP-binding subunit ClpA